MRKAAQAFRTISEVAEILQTPAHVLRFWESKFTHVKPVKRAGGRRYYRPADLELLAGIRTLLHDHGMTIRGVQKLLTEKGVRHVADYAPDAIAEVLDGTFDEEDDAAVADAGVPDAGAAPAPDTETRAVDETPDTGSESVAPVQSATASAAVTESENLGSAEDTAEAPGGDVSASDDPVSHDSVTDDGAPVSEQPADVAQDAPEHDEAEAVSPLKKDAEPASGAVGAMKEVSETEAPDAALAEPNSEDVDVSVPEAADAESADVSTAEHEPDGAESGQASAESTEHQDPTSAQPVDETSEVVPDAASDVTTVSAPAPDADAESAPVDALPAYRIAVLLREVDRATMQPPPPELDALLRRMDTLLDRMSKAGGAARW